MQLSTRFLCLLSFWTGRTWAQSPALRGGGESRELQASPQVTALQLVDASTGRVITNLKMFDTINIGGTPALSVVAVTSAATKSAKFAYGSKSNFKTESFVPYAMCGDTFSKLTACAELKAGSHSVKVTPYSGQSGQGTAGASVTVSFTLVNSGGSPVAPAPVPRPAPVPAPAPTSGCKVPKFLGDWEGGVKYPFSTSEAQGLVIGDDFVLFSGFISGISKANSKNYALNLRNANASWRPVDDLPVSAGITHGAFALVGQKMYMCGGYLGGHPGQHIDTCLVYDHAVAPGSGKQWKFFTSLPKGRAGGAMVYDPNRNALIFAGGAERPVAGNPNAVDYTDAWIYELNNPGKWNTLTNIPFKANHMSYVSTRDSSGKARHYFVGGQIGENEGSGNVKSNYEFDAGKLQWIKRKDMPFTRGHASSSTNAVPCGYIIAGGSTNEFGKTNDVSFYDIASDSWTKIGTLPSAVNTPVCDIDFDGGYYHCQMPGQNAWKRRIDA